MPASSTRVPTATLIPLVQAAEASLDTIEATLSSALLVLTAEERKRMPRTRSGFAPAARVLANLIQKRPDIAAVCNLVPDAVVEDLDNAELLDTLLPRLKLLGQMLEDSRLRWLAEAQDPTLQAYAVVNVLAQRDGSLVESVAPLARLFRSPASPEPATAEEASS